MTENNNREDFQYDYVDLILKHGKEFMAVVMPVEMSKEEAEEFKANIPKKTGDAFIDEFTELVDKYNIMLMPNMIVSQFDDESKEFYKEKSKERFTKK